VSGPGGPGAAESGEYRVLGGLLEKLMAAVRPEFRADVLAFDAADPVSGSPACMVGGCRRPARSRGLCIGHEGRWRSSGRPPLEEFAAATAAEFARSGLLHCRVPGCGYGVAAMSLCNRHARHWIKAGRPGIDGWLGALPPGLAAAAGGRECAVPGCAVWAQPEGALCRVHQRQWIRHGRPGLDEWLARSAGFRPGLPAYEQVDLRGLPPALKLEMQYALQRRRDDETVRVRPREVRGAVGFLRDAQPGSLLGPGLDGIVVPAAHRGLLRYARRVLEDLAEGAGWDAEYPRDTWQLRRLGINGKCATIRFGNIPQPWLKGLAKRWARWRLSTGVPGERAQAGIRAVARLAGFLAARDVTALAQVDRPLIERYLADLHREFAGRDIHGKQIGQLAAFLADTRRHGWDAALPADAVLYPEDYPAAPQAGSALPRHVADHVMQQVEDEARLARWDNPAYRLITLILVQCGLRISSALTLSFDCVARDSQGAPYLRYYNTKMKREALVPIDEQLADEIHGQQERVTSRWPAGTPVLFPRPLRNITGRHTMTSGTYRDALYRWLERCDIRDEHGEPVHLTPHQWRHTLGTRLINRDVPQHVVQKILDHIKHDSPQMTAHYAKLSDKTVREHWERSRKVGASGQPVRINPDGPLGDAAWTGQQLSRATQSLPNGYCQLPVVKTCPHANSCLTCPMFATTAEFLPQHHAQRQATLQIISAAEAAGHVRVAEMNRQVADNLDKIITALEDEEPDDKGAAAGAP
jgi:integrase